MSDALLGLTEVTNASNAQIASVVQSYLVQEAKILTKVTDYSSLWSKGMKSVALPRSGGTTYSQKTENTAKCGVFLYITAYLPNFKVVCCVACYATN